MVGVHCKSLFKSSPTFPAQSPTIKQIAWIFTRYLNCKLPASILGTTLLNAWHWFRHIILENICKVQLRAWQTYTNPGRKTSEAQRVVQNYWTPIHPIIQITARLQFKKEGPTWKPPASCLRKHFGWVLTMFCHKSRILHLSAHFYPSMLTKLLHCFGHLLQAGAGIRDNSRGKNTAAAPREMTTLLRQQN